MGDFIYFIYLFINLFINKFDLEEEKKWTGEGSASSVFAVVIIQDELLWEWKDIDLLNGVKDDGDDDDDVDNDVEDGEDDDVFDDDGDNDDNDFSGPTDKYLVSANWNCNNEKCWALKRDYPPLQMHQFDSPMYFFSFGGMSWFPLAARS